MRRLAPVGGAILALALTAGVAAAEPAVPASPQAAPAAAPGAPGTGALGAVRVTADSAVLRSLLLPRGKRTTWQFEYGLTEAYGARTPLRVRHRAGIVNAKVGGLAPGTTYHFRLVAANEAGTTIGRDRTFTTDPAPKAPGVRPLGAVRIRAGSATVRALLLPRGKRTTWRFEYGPTEGYGHSTKARVRHRAGIVSARLTGLQPGTTYHFRLVAQNAGGTTNGPDRTFTTRPPVRPPHAKTLPATRIGSAAATLRGIALPRQKGATWHFQYGPTEAYGAATPARKIGRGRMVSIRVKGLSPATTYHARLVVTNSAGTTTGRDITFTTDPAPAPPTVTTLPAARVRAGGAVLRGVILPRGKTATWRFQYGTTEAYGFTTPARKAGRARMISARIGGLTPGTTYHARLIAMGPGGIAIGGDVTFTTPAAH